MHLIEPEPSSTDITKALTTTTTTTATHSPTTRFVGKHAKDQKLSIFIQKRNINEFQVNGEVEEILGLVRIAPEAYRSIRQKGSGKFKEKRNE